MSICRTAGSSRTELIIVLAVVAAVLVAWVTVPLLFLRMASQRPPIDTDFVADHWVDDVQIGSALRMDPRGIFGKARYYVIVARDEQQNVVQVFYEGPGGYPDVPRTPMLITATDRFLAYEVEEGVIIVDLAAEPRCRYETSAAP